MTKSKLSRSEVMKLTSTEAVEAVLRLYLARLHLPHHSQRLITTAEVAAELGCGEAKVRDLLTPMDPKFPGRRMMAVEGVRFERGGSRGYGAGSDPDVWVVTKELVAERLAAALALAPERAPASFGPTDPMTQQSPF